MATVFMVIEIEGLEAGVLKKNGCFLKKIVKWIFGKAYFGCFVAEEHYL